MRFLSLARFSVVIARSYSFWSSARISSLPQLPFPPPLTRPCAAPCTALGMLKRSPREWYWKFFYKRILNSPAFVVEHETLVRVGLPQRGQNCLFISLQIRKQAWQRSTTERTCLILMSDDESRLRLI